MTIQGQQSEHPSWVWIIANAAGSAIGGALAGGLVLAAEEPLVGTVRTQASAAAALAPVTAVSIGLFGALVGLVQWLVLRRWLPGTGWWIAATAGGWAAAGAIAGTLSGFLSGTVTHVGPGIGILGYVVGTAGSVAAIGILPGLLQSLVLGHRIPGLAWPAAHLTALGAGVVVAFPVMLVVAALLRLNLPSAQAWAVAGVLMGTVFGMVTWRTLEKILATRPNPPSRAHCPGGASGEPGDSVAEVSLENRSQHRD
ncbi:MAG TPA: hypothetical protein VGL99_09900 [Chloroflexota bacterium]